MHRPKKMSTCFRTKKTSLKLLKLLVGGTSVKLYLYKALIKIFTGRQNYEHSFRKTRLIKIRENQN